MARKKQNTGIMETDIPFPAEGLEEIRGYTRQRDGTSADEVNVRTFEPGTDRARGGSRCGTVDYLPSEVHAEGVAIQNINHLVTTDAAIPASTVGYFVYGRASGDHFGVGNNDGTSAFTAGATASYAFACSCWDDDGYVYIAEVNTGTGGVEIKKYEATSSTAKWTLTTLTVTTGSLRYLAGMVVIGDHLYVATKKVSGSRTNSVHKINKETGAIVTLHWYSNTNNAKFVFSTGAINCLGKCGKLLGVDTFGSGSNTQSFFIIDTTKTNYASSVVVTAYTGTAANNRAKVISDGIAFFYVLASTTTGIIKKISTGGVIEFASTVMDASGCQSIAYDQSTGQLVAVTTTTPSLKQLSLTLGTATTTADPGSVTSWNDVDTDGHGYFYLWRNANASNDILKVNSTYTTTWGPSTFANTTHSGASVYKGKVTETPIAGISQIRLLTVSGGSLYRESTTGYTLVGSVFSPGAKKIFSAQHGINMYYADGSIYRYYDSLTNALTTWTASAGSMPADSQSTKARLIVNWMNRIALSGLVYDPSIIYLSATDDPTDFDTSPAVPSETQAFAINVRDFVNCMIPYSDDVMIVGGDHTITQFTGDPGIGGQIDVVSSTIGMAWGDAWTIDDKQQLYFFSSRGGVYKMQPGATPIMVSQQIKRRLENIDPTTHNISMKWDVYSQGLGVWITPHDDTKDGINYFWEERTNAWHPDFYAEKGHCPTFVHLYDGFDPDDRRIMLGGRDGHIRILSETATMDDGVPIESYVLIGPISTPFLDDMYLYDLQATLGDESGDVRWDVYAGETPEQALATMWKANGNANDGVRYGTWSAGRNFVSDVRWAGRAVYVKISSTDRWTMERIRARYSSQNAVRRRN